MKYYYDTEWNRTLSEKDLLLQFAWLLLAKETEIETFSEYIREVTSKNGTLIEIIEPNALAATELLMHLDAISRDFFLVPAEDDDSFEAIAEEFYNTKITVTIGDKSRQFEMDAAAYTAIDEALKYIINQQ